MKFKGELIFKNELCQIFKAETGEYLLYIALQDGGWVMNSPFPGDQRGLIAAMTLAIDILAGKVWLLHAIDSSQKPMLPEVIKLNKGVGK